MKIHLPASFFQHNKLKEVYYKSFLIKNANEKFATAYGSDYPAFLCADKEIRMMNLRWGTGRNRVVHQLGSPRYIIKRKEYPTAEILYFKQEILDEKAVMQCHFLRDQLYYAHVDFISSLASEMGKIVQLIRSNYRMPEATPLPGKLMIRDVDGNKLLIDQDVYLRLEYLTGKTSIIQKLGGHLSIESTPAKNTVAENPGRYLQL